MYAASSVLGQLGSLLTFPLYTRALGPSSYGILAVGLAAAGVLRTLVISGTNTALMDARIGGNAQQASRSTGAAAAWVTLACAVLAIAWLIFGSPIAAAARLGSGAGSLGWSIVAYVYVDSLLELLFACARAEGRPRLYAVTNGLRVVVTILVAAALLLIVQVGAPGAVISMAVGSVCAGLWLWFRLRIGVSLVGFVGQAEGLLRSGAPLLPANLGSWVTDLADRYLLLFITGSTALVGVYSAGYRVGALVTALFVSPFHTAYLPFMLEHAEHESAEHLYAETSRLFVAFGTASVLGLQAIALPLVRVLAGSSYLPSVRIVGIVALGCLLGGTAMLMTPKALKEKRTSTLAVAFATGAVVNVAANLLLIPSLGMTGAALATLAAYAVVLGVMLLVTPASAHPRGLGRELALTLPVAFVATAIAAVDVGGGLQQGLVAAVAAVVALALLFALGVLRVNDVGRVAGALAQAVALRGRKQP